ncbi:MAG: biotin/lipoyl-binding protein [Gemmataceae bacterium]
MTATLEHTPARGRTGTRPPPPALPSLQLARTPALARRLSRLVLAGLALLPAALLFVPWTQTVHGTGKAIAFNPVQRPQFIVSPIEGRVKKWYVVEGQRVQAGQRLVSMVDNDPNLELRLLDEERATLDRLRAAEGRVQEIEARIRNLQNSRLLAISVQSSVLQQAQANQMAAEQSRTEAQATLDAAVPNYQRQKDLYTSKQGRLASERDVELAQQALESARARLKQAEARVGQAKAAVVAAQDNLKKVDEDTAAMIRLERASAKSAEAEVASVKRDKAQIEVRIARQRAQYIDAPSDGVVHRLLANAEQGGMLVRPGERLGVLVPDVKPLETTTDVGPEQVAAALGDSLAGAAAGGGLAAQASLVLTAAGRLALTSRATPGIVVELQIDGNDLPLLRPGDPVRLQFEGWPAAQFVGWPSVAVGTFGGRVYFVDPTANDKGEFRILVEPDPDDQPWPDERYLRQGVRAQGWALLNRVSLGWEFWRQLNGFPPVREQPEGKKGQPLGPVKRKELK